MRSNGVSRIKAQGLPSGVVAGDAGLRNGRLLMYVCLLMFTFLLQSSLPGFAGSSIARAQELNLNELIREALKNSPELLVSESRVSASRYRIPQAKALPDPMFMFGYQNEGFERITLGEEQGAQGMFSLSQMFPFPGKLGLKGEMASRDTESLQAMSNATRLRIVATIKQFYYDLFLAYKTIDILKNLTDYFSRVEDAAIARYSSGMGSQQEVVMAQTEKYMLLEKEEMQKQKVQAIQGMLNSAIGRDANAPLGPPGEPSYTSYDYGTEELIRTAKNNSPEIQSRKKMIEAAEAKVKMANKEYYPDFTLGASYYPRTKGFMDMWNLTATINIPIFYKSKQEPALQEANSNLLGAKRELAATEFMLSSGIVENHSMARTADRLMNLYKEGLIPKVRQDFQLALSGYATGKIEAITVISRLKALLDTELLYWGQYTEREKAIARLDAITGRTDQEVTAHGSGTDKAVMEPGGKRE
jgi:outer membrane protein, heavy metal efflux system